MNMINLTFSTQQCQGPSKIVKIVIYLSHLLVAFQLKPESKGGDSNIGVIINSYKYYVHVFLIFRSGLLHT